MSRGKKAAGGSEHRVFFKCKYCQLLFLKPADLIEHKQMDHLGEISDQTSVTRRQLSSPPGSSHSKSDNFQVPPIPSSSRTQPGLSIHKSNRNFTETDENEDSFDSSEEEEEESDEELFDSNSTQSYATSLEDGFRCKYCLKDFPDQTKLNTHEKACPALKILNGKAHSYPCKICKKDFSSRHYMRKHQIEQHGDGTTTIRTTVYACPHCHRNFAKRKQLMAHLNCHIGQLKLNPDEVQFPIQIHNNSKPKRVPETDDLIAEKFVRENYRVFRCMLCNHSLSVRKTPDVYRKRIRDHVKSMHLVFPARTTTTTHPSSSASRKYAKKPANSNLTIMQKYRIEMQNRRRKIPSLDCPTCKLTFQTLGQRLDHQEGHEGNLPFLCTKCGQWFRYAFQIKNHLRQQH